METLINFYYLLSGKESTDTPNRSQRSTIKFGCIKIMKAGKNMYSIPSGKKPVLKTKVLNAAKYNRQA